MGRTLCSIREKKNKETSSFLLMLCDEESIVAQRKQLIFRKCPTQKYYCTVYNNSALANHALQACVTLMRL